MSIGDIPAALQQIGVKFPCHKIKRCDAMGNSNLFAMPCRHREFLGMMLCPVIEAESRHDFVLPQSLIKGRDGIHSATQENDNLHPLPLLRIFLGDFLPASYSASTRMPIPPRGEKSPITVARRGAIAATRSFKILFTIPSAKTA